MRKGVESAAAKSANAAGGFSRTKSAPSDGGSLSHASAAETAEPGSMADAEMRSASSSYSEHAVLESASAKSANSAGELSRTQSAPSGTNASCALDTAHYRSGGLLAGAPHILSRRRSLSAEPATGKTRMRMRLNKEGNLEHPSSNFHGGFLDGNVFGTNAHILESRFRWRTAASSTISYFHSIPSESFGLDKPEMRAKLAELERSLEEEDDAENTQGLRDGLREVLLGGSMLEGCLLKGATSKMLVGGGIARTNSSKHLDFVFPKLVDFDADRTALDVFDTVTPRPAPPARAPETATPQKRLIPCCSAPSHRWLLPRIFMSTDNPFLPARRIAADVHAHLRLSTARAPHQRQPRASAPPAAS